MFRAAKAWLGDSGDPSYEHLRLHGLEPEGRPRRYTHREFSSSGSVSPASTKEALGQEDDREPLPEARTLQTVALGVPPERYGLW